MPVTLIPSYTLLVAHYGGRALPSCRPSIAATPVRVRPGGALPAQRLLRAAPTHQRSISRELRSQKGLRGVTGVRLATSFDDAHRLLQPVCGMLP